jgi:membrane protein YdbS with pleckstrin-like domain
LDPGLVAATLETLEREGKQLMGIILLVLLLALILGGLGFAVHILWWIALIVLVIWLIGFVVRVGEGGSRGRWYRWLPAPRG